MVRPLGTRISGCVLITLAVLAGMPSANAATGRIVFSGAIVEPTCGVSAERVAAWVAAAPGQGQSHPTTCCGSNAAVAAPQMYTVTVAHLSHAEPDRVLRYFSDYVRASQVDAPSPTLVTQTYE